ncbi:MAG: hypothetical protein KZQ78_00455 [Candidatus Thiodiazotropha sp. (ex Ustalcina ferruginea)]|nr:hypothetical protein [Candidatus Thiodiazotropha sp. (ex Ustalcina ferruginea)]
MQTDAVVESGKYPPGDLAIWVFILAELGAFAAAERHGRLKAEAVSPRQP